MELAALVIAEDAAELEDVVAAAADVDELPTVAVEAPVQLDSSGTAAALTTPAPSTRNIVRRFMLVLRRSASKSEPVTVDLRFTVGVDRPPNTNRIFHRRIGKSTPACHNVVTKVVISPSLLV